MTTGKITKAQLEAEARRVWGNEAEPSVMTDIEMAPGWLWRSEVIVNGCVIEAVRTNRMAARRALYDLLSSLERKEKA
jgi:hypothetical protein